MQRKRLEENLKHLLFFSLPTTQWQKTKWAVIECCCSKDRAIVSGLPAGVLTDKALAWTWITFHHTQAWLLLFLCETSDQNTSMVGCFLHVWADQLLMPSTGSVVCHLRHHISLSIVTSLLCKPQSLAHDGTVCSFAGVHGEREFNIAKGMCGSLITKLREPLTVTINAICISLKLNLFIF